MRITYHHLLILKWLKDNNTYNGNPIFPDVPAPSSLVLLPWINIKTAANQRDTMVNLWIYCVEYNDSNNQNWAIPSQSYNIWKDKSNKQNTLWC